MKKNPKGGKGHKKKASKAFNINTSRKLIEKDSEEGQEYGYVVKILGGSRVLVENESNKEVQAVIPGRFRKRNYIRLGDYIIIQVRSFNKNQYDVVYCSYTRDDIKSLIKMGHVQNRQQEEEEINLTSQLKRRPDFCAEYILQCIVHSAQCTVHSA